MGVVGSISIRDNASSVLKSVRQEQTALRKDAAETRKELQRAWDKTYTAKVDTASATQKTEGLLGKVKQLGSKVVSPVIKAKDTASATISKVSNGIKTVGKKVASPVIKVKDAATSKIKSIKNAITGVAKKVTTPIIKLKDAVTSKITKVTGKLKAIGGKVFSPIVKLKDATAKGISAINSKLKSLAKTVAIPVTIAATAVIGGAVSEGAALEQSIGGVETLFKDNAGVVKANADAAFKTAGLSANEYMEQVTSFSASLLNSLSGDTATAAAVADMAMIDMADNANKFGTDMDSIQNAYQGFAKQNYTMLDNLKLGYGGTKEEMQRLLKDAQSLTGVKYDIDNLADVYNAIHAIQENLGVTGTTAKEASETFSGSFASMKSAAKNVLGNLAIGGDVTGSMEQLVESASTFLFDNAVPMIGRVMSALPGAIKTGVKKAVPKIKTLGKDIVVGLKDGLKAMFPSMAPVIENGFNAVISAVPDFISGIKSVVSTVGSLAAGFAPILPQLTAFGSGMVTTIQQVVSACVPALTSIITTVQTMLPVILPVIQTVVSTIGNIIAQAAPVIAGLVEGIGTVVSTLAPVFSTIFSEIGEKVGSVISFVSERMGFIQEVIGTVAPLIGDIISTAWGVISPVIDIVISVFEILFGVVQKVFPGIQSIIETVWGVVKPLVEGIGSVIGEIAGWFGSVADAITGSGGDSGSVGKNAEGDNNWKGGLTWVGEKGAELVDLPQGSRILPHKESVSLTKQGGGVVKNSAANVMQNTVVSAGSQDLSPVMAILTRIDENLKQLLDRIRGKDNGLEVPDAGKSKGTAKGFIGSVTVAIAKLADEIIVREDADIDEIADKVAKKVVEVVVNMG